MMTETTSHIIATVATAAILGIGGWLIRDLRRRHSAEKHRDFMLGQIVQIFTGHEADPVTDSPETPGIVNQINTLRVRQEEIAAVARRAADDVEAVRTELTPNGGSSTRDVVAQALASAEAAAVAAELASRSAERTEVLLRRHMQNGVEIMEVGRENDASFRAAFLELGVELPPFREYPPVDTGN